MRTPLFSVLALVLFSACAVSPEDTDTVRASICSSGGGDECVAVDGYCPASCSNCYGSMSEKVHVLNQWQCQPIDTGGGNGGGCGSTWQQIFGASASTQSEARSNLSKKASTGCAGQAGCSYVGQSLDEVSCHSPMGEWYCEGRLRCDYR